MIKLWLVIKDCDTKRVWTKYFENELEYLKITPMLEKEK